MCLLFFSYKTTPGYNLVLAANRDEFLSRPTAPLAFLDSDETILAGRDLQGGGTWLGINSQRKFAALTNYRDPSCNQTDVPSRGEIITNYLAGDRGAAEFIGELAHQGTRYNGFNLIVGDSRELYYYSNRLLSSGRTGNSRHQPEPRLLAPGFYGLSNRLLDDPWPKVVRGKELLHPDMVERQKVDPFKIFSHLEDTQHPRDERLPDTGVGLEWERLLSPIFIDAAGYGTRSSAVLLVSGAGEIDFLEKTWDRSKTASLCSQLVHKKMVARET